MIGARRMVLLAVLVALALPACDRLPGKPQEADRVLRPSEVRDFDTLYGTNCAGCHGADGRMGAARPLNDPLYLALVDDATLERIVGEGIPGSLHPAFARDSGGMLTDDQVALLVRALRARWGEPAPSGHALPAYRDDAAPADRAAGAARRGIVVWAARCASCHGADGRGGREAGSVVDPDYLALVTDQALRTAVICGRPDLGMPDWRGAGEDADPLGPREISDVVAWLASHREAVASEGGAEQGGDGDVR